VRLVFVTPEVPVATQPRPHHLIRGLAGLGHEVHVVALAETSRTGALDEDPSWERLNAAAASVAVVREPRWRCVGRAAAAVPARGPLQVAYCRSAELEDEVLRSTGERSPDLLYVDRIRLGFLRGVPGPRRVLDATDSMTLHYRRSRSRGDPSDRLIARLELPRIRRYEARVTADFAATFVTTPVDAAALRGLGADRVHVVPNGVDPALLTLERRPEPGRLVFLGNMSYGPNVDAVRWFVEEVWPRLEPERRGLRLDIVGNRPRGSVRDLSDGRIAVTGWVPELAPYLERAAVFVAPVRIGGGFPNKVAQALAAGIPVVSTSAGQAGIGGLVAGDHLAVADGSVAFARETLELLEDPDRAESMGRAGRRLLAATGTWPQVVRRLDDLLVDVARG
jgi:polysaccharide biosynthesis protein PslH